MLRYENVLDIKESWGMANRKEISLQEFSKILSNKLINVEDTGLEHIDNMKIQVIEEFEILAKLDSIEDSDFSEIWEMLFEWSDSMIFSETERSLNCNIKTS